MAWWHRIALLALLTGCGRPASFRDVVDGRVDLAPRERSAVAALLAQAPVPPAEVELLPADPAVRPRRAHWLRVAEERVVGAAFGGVTDPAPLADLPHLVELELAGRFRDLEGWGEHPRLERLAIVSLDDSLVSLAALAGHRALTELRVAGGRLGALDLGAAADLPLAKITLRATGASLLALPPTLREAFLTHESLGDLGFLAGLDRLERLELPSCGLGSLETLPPLPRLETILLHGNPIADLDPLADRAAFPSLRTVGARDTAVREPPPGLAAEVAVHLSPPAGDPVERWVATFREARERAPGRFVEALPRRPGTARGVSGRASWSTGTYSAPRLDYRGEIAELEGLVRLDLGEVDPALPFHGGGPLRLRADLEVAEGTARIYLRERGDLRAQALALEGRGSEHDPTAPPADPAERFDGYRYAEAVPSRPAAVAGEAVVFGTEAAVWLEAPAGPARGLRLRLSPP